MIDVRIGVDIGQQRDPTAIVVTERTERGTGRWRVIGQDGDVTHRREETESVFLVRHLERLTLGTPYPDVAVRVAGIVTTLEVAHGRAGRLHLVLDSTGVGRPVVDLVRGELCGSRCRVTAATFTATDRIDGHLSSREVRLGKLHLVSNLQALLQTERIRLPDVDEAHALARELADFELRVTDRANLVTGAFKTGAHDDLVCALGLAVLEDPHMGPAELGPVLWR